MNLYNIRNIDELIKYSEDVTEDIFNMYIIDTNFSMIIGKLTLEELYDPETQKFTINITDIDLPNKYAGIRKKLEYIGKADWPTIKLVFKSLESENIKIVNPSNIEIMGLKQAESRKWPTKEDAREFIDIFNRNSIPGISAKLIGSLVREKEQAKDIDILLSINENEIPEEYEEQLDKPVHWFVMEKIGAQWLTDAHNEDGSTSEWWDWNGLLVDIFFEHE